MNYLLDTHTLLWARFSADKLTNTQRAIIESGQEEKFISSITVWEISLKFSLGRIELGGRTPEEFIAGIHGVGIRVITPTPDQYATFYLLPKMAGHKDPFDRMIIWHAINSGLALVSSDTKMPSYKIHGLRVV
ncbi:MAG TPA: type II toxin-antitoxin system VapC family toxin [Candidatus Saccharimonadales bacterium]|nr:type II toxin-antitoxin system VapC family toxin [Candidatus Saccharimonadales bacterium]